jgi:ATP-dependent exoDNAse (exonuclease V) beta subunit
MNLQDLVILEKSFESVFFSEKDHSYLINSQPAKFSVTQLLKKYEKPFDAKKLAAIVAKKQGVMTDDVLHLWEFKKEFACLKGTLFHLYVENFLQKKRAPIDKSAVLSFIRNYPDYVSTDVFYNDIAKYISHFLKFYETWKEDHILVRPELVVGDIKTGLCGCIDNLSFNHKNNELVIFDYKSNKEIKEEGRENMLGILSHLKACNLVKYSLQLHLYSLIIERNTPFKISNSRIVWVGGESLETIDTLDVKEEAIEILKIAELENSVA